MDIDQEEQRLKDKILESQFNWWNGLMVFSGLVIAFLSTQNNCLASLLILLYFVIAMSCIYLLFKMREFRRYFQENYYNWAEKDITEGNKEDKKDIKWANKQKKLIDRTEERLKWVTSGTTIITFIYLLINFLCN